MFNCVLTQLAQQPIARQQLCEYKACRRRAEGDRVSQWASELGKEGALNVAWSFTNDTISQTADLPVFSRHNHLQGLTENVSQKRENIHSDHRKATATPITPDLKRVPNKVAGENGSPTGASSQLSDLSEILLSFELLCFLLY